MKLFNSLICSLLIFSSGAFSQNVGEKLGGMLGGKTKYETSYSFPHSARMEMTATEKGGKKTTQSVFDMASNADENVMSMEIISVDGKPQKEKSLIIFDKPNKTMLTLMTDAKGERTGMAMAFDPAEIEKTMAEAEIETGEKFDAGNASFTKTGNTREILGYTCHEYAFDSDDSEGTAWITEDADINVATFFGAMGQSDKKSKTVFSSMEGYPQGMIMEMKARDKKSNDTSEMKVLEIDLNSNRTTRPADYNIMSLSNMFGN
jgi:hypothetical protein